MDQPARLSLGLNATKCRRETNQGYCLVNRNLHKADRDIREVVVRTAAAFTLIELLVVISIIGVLIGLLLPSLAQARRTSRTAVCMSNIRQQGVGFATYAGDARGLLGTFSWKAGQSNSSFAELNGAATDSGAHMNQCVDIIRRWMNPEQPQFTDVMVDRNYTYLVILDAGHFGDRVPEPAVACPEDALAQAWQRSARDPSNAISRTGDPFPSDSPEFKQTLPAWSTYQLIPSAWTALVGDGAMVQAAFDYSKYTITVGATTFTQRRMDEVRFPSQKVAMFDLFDRHSSSKARFHAYEESKQPLMMFDSSVSVRMTKQSNIGWNPSIPRAASPTIYRYQPLSPLDPPTKSGQQSDRVFGYYRWTREGLAGIDFGGEP